MSKWHFYRTSAMDALRGCLLHNFKHMFSVFKQHYTYFHTIFHLHVFPKKTENCCLNTRTKQTLKLLISKINSIFSIGSNRSNQIFYISISWNWLKLMTLNENSQLFITGDVETENIKVFFFPMILVPLVSGKLLCTSIVLL